MEADYNSDAPAPGRSADWPMSRQEKVDRAFACYAAELALADARPQAPTASAGAAGAIVGPDAEEVPTTGLGRTAGASGGGDAAAVPGAGGDAACVPMLVYWMPVTAPLPFLAAPVTSFSARRADANARLYAEPIPTKFTFVHLPEPLSERQAQPARAVSAPPAVHEAEPTLRTVLAQASSLSAEFQAKLDALGTADDDDCYYPFLDPAIKTGTDTESPVMGVGGICGVEAFYDAGNQGKYLDVTRGAVPPPFSLPGGGGGDQELLVQAGFCGRTFTSSVFSLWRDIARKTKTGTDSWAKAEGLGEADGASGRGLGSRPKGRWAKRSKGKRSGDDVGAPVPQSPRGGSAAVLTELQCHHVQAEAGVGPATAAVTTAATVASAAHVVPPTHSHPGGGDGAQGLTDTENLGDKTLITSVFSQWVGIASKAKARADTWAKAEGRGEADGEDHRVHGAEQGVARRADHDEASCSGSAAVLTKLPYHHFQAEAGVGPATADVATAAKVASAAHAVPPSYSHPGGGGGAQGLMVKKDRGDKTLISAVFSQWLGITSKTKARADTWAKAEGRGEADGEDHRVHGAEEHGGARRADHGEDSCSGRGLSSRSKGRAGNAAGARRGKGQRGGGDACAPRPPSPRGGNAAVLMEPPYHLSQAEAGGGPADAAAATAAVVEAASFVPFVAPALGESQAAVAASYAGCAGRGLSSRPNGPVAAGSGQSFCTDERADDAAWARRGKGKGSGDRAHGPLLLVPHGDDAAMNMKPRCCHFQADAAEPAALAADAAPAAAVDAVPTPPTTIKEPPLSKALQSSADAAAGAPVNVADEKESGPRTSYAAGLAEGPNVVGQKSDIVAAKEELSVAGYEGAASETCTPAGQVLGSHGCSRGEACATLPSPIMHNVVGQKCEVVESRHARTEKYVEASKWDSQVLVKLNMNKKLAKRVAELDRQHTIAFERVCSYDNVFKRRRPRLSLAEWEAAKAARAEAFAQLQAIGEELVRIRGPPEDCSSSEHEEDHEDDYGDVRHRQGIG